MIEKILNWFTKIPTDKLLHSYLILILSLTFYDVLEIFISTLYVIISTTIFATIVIICKEYYDSKHSSIHSVEFMDVVAGYVGLIIGLLLKIL